MYNASVTPRNFEFTVFDVTFRTQLYPIAIEKIDILETCVKLVWLIINMHINLLYINYSRTQANTRHTLRMPYDP